MQIKLQFLVFEKNLLYFKIWLAVSIYISNYNFCKKHLVYKKVIKNLKDKILV